MQIPTHHSFPTRHHGRHRPCHRSHPVHCRPAVQPNSLAELGERAHASGALQEGWQGFVRVENGQSFQGLSVENNRASWNGISKDGSTITTPDGTFTSPSRSLVIHEAGSDQGFAFVPSTPGPAGEHNSTFAMAGNLKEMSLDPGSFSVLTMKNGHVVDFQVAAPDQVRAA